MGSDPSDVAASESGDELDEPSVTAVADEPAITRERAPEIQPGDVLAGRYQIEAILGKGGSGVVLRAFDRVSATVVAVKVLKAGLTHDPRWEKRFSRELRIGRPIRHANVCRIFDIGDADGYRFLTMEFATGGTLRDLIKKNQPLRPLAERLADAAGAIAGLAAIHDAGIVHRDVKPDNMLRMEDGRLVLSDFGLATDLPDSTMVSVFVGTPHYMAPEVREGDPATTRSDVWSLGVVLHEIFFGKRPERRNSKSAGSISMGSRQSALSRIERAMRALCERCLADDPAERPENAQAVQRLFERGQRSPGSIVRSRHRRATVGIASIATVIAVAAGLGVRSSRQQQTLVSSTKAGVLHVLPTGEPADWTKVARTVAKIVGRVHCFSAVDNNTVRLIWGEPKRAEDIDVHSGARRDAPITPDTYAIGCPDFSPTSNRLLFTSYNSAGATEIRLITRDSQSPSVVTPGSEPLWLRNGDEFVYTLDQGHAAVYSLPTMRLSLLADSGFGGQLVFQKAASTNSDRVALLLTNEKEEWAVSIYEGAMYEQQRTVAINAARRIHFDRQSDGLWISYQLSRSLSTLARLDWRTSTLRHVGRLPGSDVLGIVRGADAAMVLGRRVSHDLWLVEGSQKKKLTTDGETVSAAIGPGGLMLLGRRTEDGTYSIWRRNPDGGMKRVTKGPSDVAPDFSGDGRLWTYADYVDKSIMLCSSDGDECRSIRKDEFLPTWPRFSTDGKNLAYVTQLGTPRLIMISVESGDARHLGPAHGECPPIWSSETSVWAVEGSPGNFHWSERDVMTSQRTGKRVSLDSRLMTLEEGRCWPAGQKQGSPFLQRLRVETAEDSELIRLPADALLED